MNDRDQELIWEIICGKTEHVPVYKPGQQKLVEETAAEQGLLNAKRGEAKGLLNALSSWIDSADGEDLHRAHDHILKAYQIADYPDASRDEDEIPRGGHDEIDDDPAPRETDQEKYGYEGDR
tara:strand:+ start:160 stop:525 length:366 start_codon:yes stop_codon:yes gene_type:complete